MKSTKIWLAPVSAVILALSAFSTQAATITIGGGSPINAFTTSNDNSNCDAACVAAIFGTSTVLDENFKNDFDTGESGTLAGSYNLVYSGDSGFTITFTGGLGDPIFDCPECYLVVKDGNNTPAQYFFNLGSWNGTDTIVGTGFWEGVNGSISHVEIFGGSTIDCCEREELPEPGSLALLGLGLLGLGFSRRRSALRS